MSDLASDFAVTADVETLRQLNATLERRLSNALEYQNVLLTGQREITEKFRDDVSRIGEAFFDKINDEESIDQEDYDEIVEELNRRLRFELPVRSRDYAVTVTFTTDILVSAKDEDEATENAADAVRRIEQFIDRDGDTDGNSSYNYDGTSLR